MKRRILISLLLTACLLCSCTGQKSCSTPEKPETPFVDEIVIDEYVEASVEDTINVHLYVYTAQYLYLFSDTPIEVYAPGNSPFVFVEEIYKLNPHSLLFPLGIKIKVPKGMEPGEIHTILLPMRLRYKSKADSTLLTRPDVIRIPVHIVENDTDRRRKHRFRVEYVLE